MASHNTTGVDMYVQLFLANTYLSLSTIAQKGPNCPFAYIDLASVLTVFTVYGNIIQLVLIGNTDITSL
jgi:hypothetical protein